MRMACRARGLALLLALCPMALGAQEGDGMLPVLAADVVPGEYAVQVSSSASMFRVADAVLRVSGDGAMAAELVLGGSGYQALYMGTAEQAARAPGGAIQSLAEAGAPSRFVVPVEALNVPVACASLSRRKQQWYDRQLVFRADSLPPQSLLVTPWEQQRVALADGAYVVDVSLSGGSGRASVASPARVVVKDGRATARLAWSSSSYDYMRVNGERFMPRPGESVSVFDIPVFRFDYDMPVIADTTAMSQSHEVAYWLYFSLGSAKKDGARVPVAAFIVAGIVLCCAAALLWRIWVRKK